MAKGQRTQSEKGSKNASKAKGTEQAEQGIRLPTVSAAIHSLFFTFAFSKDDEKMATVSGIVTALVQFARAQHKYTEVTPSKEDLSVARKLMDIVVQAAQVNVVGERLHSNSPISIRTFDEQRSNSANSATSSRTTLDPSGTMDDGDVKQEMDEGNGQELNSTECEPQIVPIKRRPGRPKKNAPSTASSSRDSSQSRSSSVSNVQPSNSSQPSSSQAHLVKRGRGRPPKRPRISTDGSEASSVATVESTDPVNGSAKLPPLGSTLYSNPIERLVEEPRALNCDNSKTDNDREQDIFDDILNLEETNNNNNNTTSIPNPAQSVLLDPKLEKDERVLKSTRPQMPRVQIKVFTDKNKERETEKPTLAIPKAENVSVKEVKKANGISKGADNNGQPDDLNDSGSIELSEVGEDDDESTIVEKMEPEVSTPPIAKLRIADIKLNPRITKVQVMATKVDKDIVAMTAKETPAEAIAKLCRQGDDEMFAQLKQDKVLIVHCSFSKEPKLTPTPAPQQPVRRSSRPQKKKAASTSPSCTDSDLNSDSSGSPVKRKQPTSRRGAKYENDPTHVPKKSTTLINGQTSESEDDEKAKTASSSGSIKGGRGKRAKGAKVIAVSSDEDEVKVSNKKKRVKRRIADSDESEFELSDDGSIESVAESGDEQKSDANSDYLEDEDEEVVGRKGQRAKRGQAKGKGKVGGAGATKKKSRIVFNVSSDEEDLDANGKKKKKRKILTDEDLKESTRTAGEAEKSRRQRMLVKQKLYNEILETASTSVATSTGERRLILELDVKTKQVMVEIDPRLVVSMKPHQVKGIKFLYDCTIESVDEVAKEESGSGCVLAHSMGLGKTFQVISYIHTCFTNVILKQFLKTALIVVPVNVSRNWQNEFNIWLFQNGMSDFKCHDLGEEKTVLARQKLLLRWKKEGGVLIIGHTTFSSLVGIIGSRSKQFPPAYRSAIRECLVEPGADIVVVDEGHYIKNFQSQLNKALSQVSTLRRVILTGTPLQNNLEEYHTMVSFVKPSLLGTLKEFRNRFANPIKNGQHQDSSTVEVSTMKKRAHVLHKLLEGCVQRFDYNILVPYLQPKHEYVLYIQLTDSQIKLYQHYLEHFAREPAQGTGGRSSLFTDCSILRMICAHPALLYDVADRTRERNFLNEESASFTDSDSEDGGKRKAKKPKKDKSDQLAYNSALADESWFNEIVPKDAEKVDLQLSGKIALVFEILNQCERIGDKVIIFSQSLDVLGFIENILFTIDRKTNEDRLYMRPKANADNGLRDTWTFNQDYFVIDGSKSAEARKVSIDKFNNPENLRARLFLLSTKAGSVGVNLVGANRCIIFDASWNPTHDVQAIFRIFRFGQNKPTYVYRLVSKGTMEERVYERQIIKESLAARVVDEQQIARHFSENEVSMLYRFEPNVKEKAIPLVPKDRLLADFLVDQKTKDVIIAYHEHDSLLTNRPDEELSEEERKLAWDEYEVEREHQYNPQVQVNQFPNPLLASMMGGNVNLANLAQYYQNGMFGQAGGLPQASSQFMQSHLQDLLMKQQAAMMQQQQQAQSRHQPATSTYEQLIRQQQAATQIAKDQAFRHAQFAQTHKLATAQQDLLRQTMMGQASHSREKVRKQRFDRPQTYPEPETSNAPRRTDRPPNAHEQARDTPPPPGSQQAPIDPDAPRAQATLPSYDKMNMTHLFEYIRNSDPNVSDAGLVKQATLIIRKGSEVCLNTKAALEDQMKKHQITEADYNMKVAKSWKEMTNLKKIHADILRFNEVNEHRELAEYKKNEKMKGKRKPASLLIEEVD